MSAQAVVLAIGQGPSSGPFTRCGLRPDGRVAADERTLATAMPGVWAAGDVVSGPASVIEAIAMGRRAAAEIDKALGGEGHIDETLADREPATQYLGRRHHFATLERAIPARLPAARRVGSFELIEASFDQEAAVHEAARCLACDLRLSLPAAVLAPRRDELLEMLPAVADALPEAEGVFTLLDQQRNVLAIKGVMNLRQAVRQALAENPLARWFRYELDPMYTKRESELIQQYLQQHGHLPGSGDDDLDDLF